MDTAKLHEFKALLLREKMKIMNGGMRNGVDDLHVSTDDLSEEGDLANSVIHQQVSFNMRDRELAKMRAIDEALERIEDGTYGYCEDCGEPIGEKRLMAQPWATLCVEHAEEREKFKKVV